MGEKTGWIEKRQFERIVATLKIDYRRMDSMKALEHDHYKKSKTEHISEKAHRSPLYHAVTKDISMGGLSILGQEPFNVGDLVEISLHLPKYKSVLKFMSQVRRTESFIELGRTIHRAGLQTLAINQADLDRIEKYILAQKTT